MEIRPSQLTKAREIRGIKIQELANMVDLSRQSVSYYERGERVPHDSVVVKIADKLNFPVEFFCMDEFNAQRKGAAFFRTLKSSTMRSRTAVMNIGEEACRIHNYLSQYLNLPKPDFPFVDFITKKETLDEIDIKTIAQITREHWNLSDDPISSLLTLFESKGIVVVNGGSVGNQTDACFISYNIPVIVLGEKDGNPGTAFRQNFSLSHELGHILLHRHITEEDISEKKTLDQIENEANLFASMFLMPEKPFLDSVLSTSLDFLLSLKKRWNTSVSAMVIRCKSLGILDEQSYTNIQKQISYRRWRTIEPYDLETPIQRPQLFRLSFELLIDERILSKQQILDDIKLSKSDIISWFSLKKDFFDDSKSFDLKIISH